MYGEKDLLNFARGREWKAEENFACRADFLRLLADFAATDTFKGFIRQHYNFFVKKEA